MPFTPSTPNATITLPPTGRRRPTDARAASLQAPAAHMALATLALRALAAFAFGFGFVAVAGGACAGELPAYDDGDALPLPVPPSTVTAPPTLGSPLAAPVTPVAPTPGSVGLPAPAGSAAPNAGPSLPPPPAPSVSTPPSFSPAAVGGGVGEEPRRGRVKAGAGRVNVRAGPGEEFEIIVALPSGTPLTVYARAAARNGDAWYKVDYPEGRTVGIRAADVTWEEPFEIPATGVPGIVNKDDVNLYVRAWDRGTVVGQAQRGLPVVVMSTRDLWLNILAPATARAYIHADYVDVQGAPPPADAAPAVNPELAAAADAGPGAPGRSRSKLSPAQQKAFETYNQSITSRLQAEERAREEEYRRVLEAWTKRRTAVDELDAEIARIDAEGRARRSGGWVATDAATRLPYIYDPAETGFTGWIEYIGRLGNRPAAFRLVKGGETVFLLRSAKFRLEDHNFKRVWINGFSEPAPGAEANVFIVTDLRVLGEPPEALRGAVVRFTHPDTAPVPDSPGQGAATVNAAGPVEVVQYGGAQTVVVGASTLPEVIGAPADSGAAVPAWSDPGRVPMGASGFAPVGAFDLPATVDRTTIVVPAAPGPVTPAPVVAPQGSLPDVIGRPGPAPSAPSNSPDGPVVIVQ